MKLSDKEREFARKLHAAAIARGKAEAALERVPGDIPKAFRMNALSRLALAQIAWLKVYCEIVAHFQAEALAPIEARSDETPKSGSARRAKAGKAPTPVSHRETQSND